MPKTEEIGVNHSHALFKLLIYASAARVLNTLILRNDRRLFFFMFKKKRDKRSMNGIVLMLTATP